MSYFLAVRGPLQQSKTRGKSVRENVGQKACSLGTIARNSEAVGVKAPLSIIHLVWSRTIVVDTRLTSSFTFRRNPLAGSGRLRANYGCVAAAEEEQNRGSVEIGTAVGPGRRGATLRHAGIPADESRIE